MRAFEESPDGTGGFVAGLSTPERLVLAQVTGDVVELLGGEEGFLTTEDDDASEMSALADSLGDGSSDDLTPGPAGLSGPSDEGAVDDVAASDLDDDSIHPQLRELLDGMDDHVVLPPTDPAVRRLLPDASDDPEVAQEFRRFTDDDLRQRKVDRLLLFAELLLEAAPSRDEDELLPFVVLADEGDAVAGALGDIRQVIGARLDLQTDEDTEALYDAVSATWERPDHEPEGEPHAHAGEALSGPELFLGSVFLLAGFLQESLTDCLLRQHRAGRRPR